MIDIVVKKEDLYKLINLIKEDRIGKAYEALSKFIDTDIQATNNTSILFDAAPATEKEKKAFDQAMAEYAADELIDWENL